MRANNYRLVGGKFETPVLEASLTKAHASMTVKLGLDGFPTIDLF